MLTGIGKTGICWSLS